LGGWIGNWKMSWTIFLRKTPCVIICVPICAWELKALAGTLPPVVTKRVTKNVTKWANISKNAHKSIKITKKGQKSSKNLKKWGKICYKKCPKMQKKGVTEFFCNYRIILRSRKDCNVGFVKLIFQVAPILLKLREWGYHDRRK
jgi:hypothetical protein